MRARWIPLAACLLLAPCAVALGQDKDGESAKQDAGGAVEIDQKWIDEWKAKWKLTDADVARLKRDVADFKLAHISAAYARDMAADEPKARRSAMSDLSGLILAAADEQEAHGAVRVLERFCALKDERARAPERFGDIAGKLRAGTRRTVVTGAWIRAWCALGKYDEARKTLAGAQAAYGEKAPLLHALGESIRVAEVRAALQPGGTAPPLRGTAFGSVAVDTAEWRGSVVVVWFWSRSEKQCVMRMPEMNVLAQQFGRQGVRWLGVAVDRDAKAAKQFVQANALEWPQLCEPGGFGAPAVRAWAVERVPRLWVLDRKGVVRGVDPATGKALSALLSTLVAEKSD